MLGKLNERSRILLALLFLEVRIDAYGRAE